MFRAIHLRCPDLCCDPGTDRSGTPLARPLKNVSRLSRAVGEMSINPKLRLRIVDQGGIACLPRTARSCGRGQPHDSRCRTGITVASWRTAARRVNRFSRRGPVFLFRPMACTRFIARAPNSRSRPGLRTLASSSGQSCRSAWRHTRDVFPAAPIVSAKSSAPRHVWRSNGSMGVAGLARPPGPSVGRVRTDPQGESAGRGKQSRWRSTNFRRAVAVRVAARTPRSAAVDSGTVLNRPHDEARGAREAGQGMCGPLLVSAIAARGYSNRLQREIHIGRALRPRRPCRCWRRSHR